MLYIEDHEARVKLPNGEMSNREYVKVGIITKHVREYEDYPTETKQFERDFYLDPKTGLVVFDVARYETWVPEPATLEEPEEEEEEEEEEDRLYWK